VNAGIDNTQEIVIMSSLFNLITFVLMSLTVSATSSLRQNALLMFEQLREATVKNQMKFDKLQQSIRMDETLSNFSVTNAAASQAIASSYYLLGIYADAACSILKNAIVYPVDTCLSLTKSRYIYSSADKTMTMKTYDDSKCVTEKSSYTYPIVESCIKYGTDGSYLKYSVTPTISDLNTEGFFVK
jgi:hypothetical protein